MSRAATEDVQLGCLALALAVVCAGAAYGVLRSHRPRPVAVLLFAVSGVLAVLGLAHLLPGLLLTD